MAEIDIQKQITATVVAASPLFILVDGATVTCPAAKLSSYTPVMNDRVFVTLRNPTMPMVQGKVS